jgi:hypothetical protein
MSSCIALCIEFSRNTTVTHTHPSTLNCPLRRRGSRRRPYHPAITQRERAQCKKQVLANGSAVCRPRRAQTLCGTCGILHWDRDAWVPEAPMGSNARGRRSSMVGGDPVGMDARSFYGSWARPSEDFSRISHSLRKRVASASNAV